MITDLQLTLPFFVSFNNNKMMSDFSMDDPSDETEDEDTDDDLLDDSAELDTDDDMIAEGDY